MIIPPLVTALAMTLLLSAAALAENRVAPVRDIRSINAVDFGLSAGSRVDQSPALADALRHASETDGIDTVYVPEGIFYCASAIVLSAGVNLVGAGPGKTVFEHRDASRYLVLGKSVDFRGSVISGLTFSNTRRTLLMQHVRNLRFSDVEFLGGIVRFENSSGITLSCNVFNENRGKSGYASSECDNVKIIGNTFNSVEKGSINLSGHSNCHVSENFITSPALIDSGYAGIRLPNGATSNLVENNTILNHGRGLFVLSSSKYNTLRNNVVSNTMYQGVLIQSSCNLLEGNEIIDAGSEAIYIIDAAAASSPTPSIADHNTIRRNVISDTDTCRSPRCTGLRIMSKGNSVVDNVVSKRCGRLFGTIKSDAENKDHGNTYGP